MFCIEIEIDGTWLLFDDRSFTTRSEAQAEADLLAAAHPHDSFAIVGIF